MWTFVDEPAAPHEFLAQVLPQSQEMYLAQYKRACTALQQRAFAHELSAWAVVGGKPAGLALVMGDKAPELFVAVREAWRGRGFGAELVEKVCVALRQRQGRALVASGVSSANGAAVRLLQTAGFVGVSTGSLRMRRPQDAPLPCCEIAPGYVLRALAAGEESAYVRLQHACFPEERPWTAEDFRQEFLTDSFNAYERIFVAEHAGRLVGTASAWQIDYGEGLLGLVHWVGVDPAHRGQGLGAALNVRVLQELAARGYRDAWLNTSRDRAAAVRLYERLGFVVDRELYTYTLKL